MDRNCVGKAIKYFYQVKKVKENHNDCTVVLYMFIYFTLVNNPIVNTAIIRGQLKEQLKAPKIVKGQGEPFCTSWLTHERLLYLYFKSP
ncbi:hypothetical protein DVH24_021523 [Malus domestica]|uniref:Uncharacterized protein n=1 Tax=Malus domestica TaxID=3750 RepID=A0A498K398_MALDO|nr:hypothetical protein DVH24_021523 [Malus domestica]